MRIRLRVIWIESHRLKEMTNRELEEMGVQLAHERRVVAVGRREGGSRLDGLGVAPDTWHQGKWGVEGRSHLRRAVDALGHALGRSEVPAG